MPQYTLQSTEIDLDVFRKEFDGCFQEMKEFEGKQPDDIFMKLAAWSARASEIRSWIVRSESRKTTAFRTREIDPFLEEIDRQYKFWSRTQAVREMDFKMAGGNFT